MKRKAFMSDAAAQILQTVVSSAANAAASPSDEHLKEVKRAMDAVQPQHLGLTTMPRRIGTHHVIRSQIVCECPGFELCIFLFPASARLPLHDHPGMTVLSKVLYGSIALRAYDWEEPVSHSELSSMTNELERQERAHDAKSSRTSDASNFHDRPPPPVAPPPRDALRRIDTVLTPEAPTFCLQPHFANIHSFEALTDCAVLDLLLPPYDDDAGRTCHFFANVHGDGDRIKLIVAAPEPHSLDVRNAPYKGPVVRIPQEVQVASTDMSVAPR